MILILDQAKCSRIPGIPLRDVDYSMDLKVGYREIEESNFVVLVNYEEGRFRFLKNRKTGQDLIMPLNMLNKVVREMLEFCDRTKEYEDDEVHSEDI